MAILRFLFRRLVAQRLLALGVVLTLAFSVGVMASGPIYTDAARDFILASSIATAGTPIKNVRVDVLGPTNQHRTLEVSGIFDPPERLDAFWFGEGSPFPLGDSEDPVPVIVDR